MASELDEITPKLAEWIGKQRIFFVATAPVALDGHINCSPKGLDTLRVLGPRSVAYLDLTGSGIETTAHLRENGRIVVMFCAFEGPPKIVRLYGRGRILIPGEPAFDELRPRFPQTSGVRSLVHIDVSSIRDSCGFGVPRYEWAGDRDQLPKYHAASGEAKLEAYRRAKNAASLDGLPGI